MQFKRWTCRSILLLATVLLPACAETNTVYVIGPDGKQKFTSIQAAIDSIPANSTTKLDIHIKPGTYTEHITIPAGAPPIHMFGDDAAKTVLVFNLTHNVIGPDGKPIGTAKSASTTVRSNDFEADDLTFSNSTPRDISQALALAAEGDRQIYRHCRFLGWQDTLFTNGGPPPMTPGDTRPSSQHSHNGPATTTKPTSTWSNRLYFENCYIEGGVDFIFGASTAVFNHCEIKSKRSGYLTAASTLQEAEYGYVFMNCNLTAADNVKPGEIYLGRPWRDYANVIYMNCNMGAQINPLGWSPWSSVPQRIHTVHYAEYKSYGPGATPDKRVPWSHQLTDEQAAGITIQSVLGGGDNWNPPVQP
jgi:pectinesterase